MLLNQLDTVEAEVWQTVQEFNQAFASNDPDRYFLYIDPEIVVLTLATHTGSKGWSTTGGVRVRPAGGLQPGGIFQELQPKIQIFGEVAVVTYYSRGSYGRKAPPGPFTSKRRMCWRRETGWKVVHIHVSPGSPPRQFGLGIPIKAFRTALMKSASSP
jgi:ketosteroid isomerase-like protein